MKRYKLDTGLWEVKEKPEFDNDKDAWEYLRKKLLGKFATLYREETVIVKCNNEAKYLASYNAKWGPKPIGYGREDAKILTAENNTYTYWVPVLSGITDDEYQ